MLLFDFSITGNMLLWSLIGISAGLILLIQIMKMLGRKRAESDLHESIKAVDSHTILKDRNKYPAVNFLKYRAVFINLGLVISLGVTFLLLGWTRYEHEVFTLDFCVLSYDNDEILELPPPRTYFPSPPPLQKLEAIADDTIVPDTPKVVECNGVSPSTNINDAHHKRKPQKPASSKAKVPMICVCIKEEMPRFPGCEEIIGSIEEKKQCADRKMLEFIYQNLQYPQDTQDRCIEGMVVVGFTVELDGSISNIEILRNIGGGAGAEAIRVIELMNQKGIKWIPGKQRGQNVRVQFILPVKFKLN